MMLRLQTGMFSRVFQFPAIAKYELLWPQLYSALRTKALTVITTHSTLSAEGEEELRVDDMRSEPLRHALVQKTDYRFEVRRHKRRDNLFEVKTSSAISQELPGRPVLWSREELAFMADSEDLFHS